AALALAPAPAPAQAQAPSAQQADIWTRLSFLIGEWQGVGSGAPGEAVGGTSFTFGLDKNILVRKNWAKYPPKAGETAGLSHEDLMIIYPSPAGFRAVYFDNEGHVIQYLVSFPAAPRSVVFETDPAQPGPRFRLAYELKENGVLENVFWVAPPGGEFKVYVRGSLKKK
ncbi:MAG: hypothetical protein ABFD80_03560, partial [Acidobacteriota bacterium]